MIDPHRFTAEALDAFGGPTWLAQARLRAHAAFVASNEPQAKDEEWVYGRIGELDLSAYAPLARCSASSGATALAGPAAELMAALGERSGLAVALDGRVASLELDEAARADGVELSSLALSAEPLGNRPSALVTRSSPEDPYAHLADALLEDAVVVSVPKGVRVAHPIVVVHELTASASGAAVSPRTIVAIGEQAEATVVEIIVSGSDASLSLPSATIEVGDGAHYTHLNLQELGSSSWQLGYQASTVGRDATFRSFVTALGGDYARHRTHSVLAGENGESQLFAVYFGHGDQVEDFRTIQEHAAPRTRSELVFKGAVAGHARSVYSGLIHMQHGAKRADATQTNRNLVLSEGAHADSVPNLDIEENDVRCSHASAVGPVDREQLFYLETRGVPRPAAERLVLLGFFEELVQRAPERGYASYVRDAVTSRLAESDVLAGALLASEGAGAAPSGGQL